mmetsp:Transcript_18978/g.34978  ORF Transcript_18978/g.34978 Transcript_18978/m.34978 type:complete len:213 (+) Transcript_18978:428-1066(+)
MWAGVELTSDLHDKRIRRRSFSPEDLDMIEQDFRLILSCSNIIGRIEVLDNMVVAKQSTRPIVDGPRPPMNAYPSSQTRASANESAPEVESPSCNEVGNETVTPGTIPETLCLKSLYCTIDGSILWAMVPELASLELMFHLVTECDFAWDHIELEMQKRGVELPEFVHPMDLCTMTPRDISRAMANINYARLDLLEHLGDYFQPNQGELLYE